MQHVVGGGESCNFLRGIIWKLTQIIKDMTTWSHVIGNIPKEIKEVKKKVYEPRANLVQVGTSHEEVKTQDRLIEFYHSPGGGDNLKTMSQCTMIV